MGLFDFLSKKEKTNAVDMRKARDIMSKVVKTQLSRFGQEISDWKNGLDSWEDTNNPQTAGLITVYNDLVLDPHLTAAMETRKSRTLSKDFKICNEEGENIPEESDIFNSLWFRDYIKYSLDSRFFGYSVIQFGDRVGKGFDYIKLVPREYVYPQKMAVRQSPYSNTPIVPIKTGKYAAWTQFIGKRGDDLGLLAKAAPMMIYKKTTQGAWAEFCELFGAPFRLGKTDIRNDDLRENMYFMLENMGRNAYGVFSHDDELEFIGDKKTDAYEVYDKLIDRANSEVSKLILGSTMVMDAGSSRSQAEVHERTLGAIDKDDSLFIQEIVNNDLIPWLNKYHGFNITGYWKWDDSEKISKAEQFERDIKIIQTGKYNVPADYITETYGVPLEEVEDQEAEPENLSNSLEVKKKALSILDNEPFCGVCGGVSHDLDNLGDEDVPPINWDEVTINDMINGVYSGKYTAENLPESVYFRIAKELTKGMDKGLRAVGKAADTYDKDFLRSLKHNAHVFSGAKTFQEVRLMSDFIADNQGRRVPFKEYEAKAREIFDDFNETYLKTEIFQAENSATMASKWQDIEEDKDILPMLKYQTVGDERVRADHRPLDGVTRPVSDPFWDTYYPPNGWRCRCEVLQEDEDEEATKLGGVKLPDVPPSMQINVGKKKVLFGPEHPYFIVEDQFKELKDNNFGLPIPKEAQIVEPKKVKLNIENVKQSKNLVSTETVAEILDNQNGASEIINKSKTSVGFRGFGEFGTAGARKWQKKTGANNYSALETAVEGHCVSDNAYINVKVKKGDKLDFTSIKMDYTADDLKKLQNKDFLAYSKGDGNFKFVHKGYKFAESFGADKKVKFYFSSAMDNILNKNIQATFTHEVNHLIQNKYDPLPLFGQTRFIMSKLMRKMKVNFSDSATFYGQVNHSEFFAENLTVYIHSNEYMKQNHKKAYNFIEALLKEYGIFNTFKIAK